jgi:hypothetical protein
MYFRFGDVATALDMGLPALRRWLQQGLVGVQMGLDRKGWLEFTLHDVAVLALVKPMAEWGMPVHAAHKIAVRAMRELAGPWSGDGPIQAYWQAWRGKTLYITRRLNSAGKPSWALHHTQGETVAFGNFLSLIPELLIRSAIERAIESAESRDRRRA